MAILRASIAQDRTKLTEIGRLYKGSPKGTSVRKYAGGDDYASHYLRFEPDDRFKLSPATTAGFANLHEELKARWESLISKGSVSIRFPYQGVSANWQWSNKLVKMVGDRGKTFVECDGATCTKWTQPGAKRPEFIKGSKPCAAGPEDKDCPLGCKPYGMLTFYVPELHPGGVVLFPLKGPIDVGNIQSYLNSYAAFDLTAVPFSLFRRSQEVSYVDSKGVSQSKINWGLHLEIDPTIAQLMLQGRATAYERQLASGNVGQLSPASQPVLEAAVIAAPDYRQSQQWMSYQNAITRAAQSGDRAQITALAEAEKRSIGRGDFDMAGMTLVDREVVRAMDMISAAGVTSSPQKPQWQIDLESAETRLGLNRDRTKKIAADNGIELKKVPPQKLAQLIELMEIEAENSVMDAEVVELPMADQIRVQIKAAIGNAKALQTIKVSISMQAEQLSPAIAGALTDQVNSELKKCEVAA